LLCRDTLGKDKIDVLALDYDSPEKVIREQNALIPKRLLWGTDEPWTKVAKMCMDSEVKGTSYEKEKIFLDSLAETIKEEIAWLNPRIYLGI